MNLKLYRLKRGSLDTEGLRADAYRFWKQLWEITLEPLGETVAGSDEFLRHDELAVLRHCDEIIGLFGFSWWDLKADVTWEHSYFGPLPPSARKSLQALPGEQLMTMGYLSVACDWRRAQAPYRIADLLVGVAVKVFVTSGADYLFAFTRNDRKTNELGRRHGAEKIGDTFYYRGSASDMLLFRRESALVSRVSAVGDVVQQLWQLATAAAKRGDPNGRGKLRHLEGSV